MNHHDHATEYLLHEILEVLRDIRRDVRIIRREISPKHQEIIDFTLSQLRGGDCTAMPITGTPVGTTSTFQIGFVPATDNVPLQSGPTVTVDDPLVTLGAVDASSEQFTAAVDPSDTATSYNVKIDGVNGAGDPVTHTFNVPILPAITPPPAQITDFTLDQVS